MPTKYFDIIEATDSLEVFRFRMYQLHAELVHLNPSYRKIDVVCL
jgi:hypothetical protein